MATVPLSDAARDAALPFLRLFNGSTRWTSEIPRSTSYGFHKWFYARSGGRSNAVLSVDYDGGVVQLQVASKNQKAVRSYFGAEALAEAERIAG